MKTLGNVRVSSATGGSTFLQEERGSNTAEMPIFIGFLRWLGDWDSNLDWRSQSPDLEERDQRAICKTAPRWQVRTNSLLRVCKTMVSSFRVLRL
jgi:hypothetical protein